MLTEDAGHTARNLGIGTGLLLALALVFYWRAAAPIHGVASAEECERAYATAKTHSDSLSIDFISYPAGRGVRGRCGMRSPTPMLLMQR